MLSREFSIGLSTEDFSGTKKVGENRESIGLCGDGKIYFNTDNSNQQTTVQVNEGDFKFHEGLVFGVGFIFRRRKVLFTANGKALKTVDLPQKLVNKLLYPAISVGSRETHKVEINLGLK